MVRLPDVHAAVNALSRLHLEVVPRFDLSGCDLRGVTVDGSLRAANLMGANLQFAILIGRDLGTAWLNRADLREAVLQGADLRKADLRTQISGRLYSAQPIFVRLYCVELTCVKLTSRP
jgi:uncharacterized protein YjbI with pentapeptide repeats